MNMQILIVLVGYVDEKQIADTWNDYSRYLSTAV